MSSSHQISTDVKAVILALTKERIAYREIARRVGFSEGAVRKFIKKYNDTGSLARTSGSGRKPKLTIRENRIIKRSVLQNRFATASEIRDEVYASTSTSVHTRTIQRELNKIGFRAMKPAKKPLLTARMKKNRLEWAKDKKNWTPEDWYRVVFSDESKFNLFGSDGKTTVRRRSGERFREDCCSPTVKHSPYVMIWGCITGYGMGSLEFVRGSMNAAQYENTIRERVLPTIEGLTEFVAEPIFQDDSAPCHRARSVSY
jgi:transposase